MRGLPMPAAVIEMLSDDVSGSTADRYLWLNDKSSVLPEIFAFSVSDDSPMSVFFAKNEKLSFLGLKLIFTFWNASENIAVLFSAVSKSFLNKIASVMDSFGIICL